MANTEQEIKDTGAEYFYKEYISTKNKLDVAIEALRKISILPSRTGSRIAGETYRFLTK